MQNEANQKTFFSHEVEGAFMVHLPFNLPEFISGMAGRIEYEDDSLFVGMQQQRLSQEPYNLRLCVLDEEKFTAESMSFSLETVVSFFSQTKLNFLTAADVLAAYHDGSFHKKETEENKLRGMLNDIEAKVLGRNGDGSFFVFSFNKKKGGNLTFSTVEVLPKKVAIMYQVSQHSSTPA